MVNPTLRPAAPEVEPASAPGGAGHSGAGPDVIEIGTPRRRRSLLVRWPAAVAGATHRWATRPLGRLVLPGLLIAVLVGATGTAGAYLVPATALPSPPAPPASQPVEAPTTVAPDPGNLPTALPTATAAGIPGAPAREAAKLAPWALPLSTRLQVPPTALEAYGYAQWVLEQTQPGCRLSWTTLAAIGRVESNHGYAGGATLTPDGRAFPPIVGPALDGQGGRRLITDTDAGALDNDARYDRAVGPMQFIPTTWRSWATDADGDGMSDPHDVDDAALAAAKYLCADNRDLSVAGSWWQAVLSYNNVQAYADSVFETANRYGQLSRDTP